MAVLDAYLQSQLDHGATHFLLEGGKPIAFVFDGKPRAMTAENLHPQTVTALVTEIAPPHMMDRFAQGDEVAFRYEYANRSFKIRLRPSPNGMMAIFRPNPIDEALSEVAEVTRIVEEEAHVDRAVEPALFRLFRRMLEIGASDMHLSCGEPPMFRVSGDMVRGEGLPRLEDDGLREILLEVAPERNREEFLQCGDTDFALELPGEARFRANLFRDRNGAGAVFRVIPHKILSVEELGLPDEVRRLCFLTKGLVLVTGPTGSGKSTTLAALVDHVNTERNDHIITIEDPIEFVHPNKSCLINQREVKLHTKSFQSALRAALREDPDILLVGEMRDLETISIAIETAETGHLVFGTLHTSTAPSTVDRLIDVFPSDRQEQIRTMLSESLKGVIAQTLCRKIGGGRIAAYEILIGTPAVSALIREGKTFQIPSMMQTGKKFGMCTLNDSLTDLVRKKLVEPKEAYIKAVDKGGLLGLFKSNGLDTSFLSEVGGGT
ncbi:MAG: Twitching mobility protein [Fibrobacterota bacterium]|jgi:twitching motility protein PilT